MKNYMIHNGTIVEVPEDALMHYKYIKREKKNGKWVYYYNDAEVKKAQENADQAKRNLNSASARRHMAQQGSERFAYNMKTATYNSRIRESASSMASMRGMNTALQQRAKVTKDKETEAQARKDKADKKLKKAKKSVKRIAGKTVASVLTTASSSMHKAKKKLKKFLKKIF